MANRHVFNYAGPGATVGVQAGNIVITGGIFVGPDGVSIPGEIVTDDAEEDTDQ